MARKLFVSLEEDQVLMTGDDAVTDEVIEQQEDSTEVAEIVADIREDLDTLEESIDAGDDAEATKDIVEDAVENDEPMDATTATLVQESINTLFKRTGTTSTRVVASLESYTGSRTDRMYATKVTLEGIKDTLAKYWENVKKFFAKMWQGIVQFYKTIFAKKEALVARIANLATKASGAKEVKEKAKVTVAKAYAGTDALSAYVKSGSDEMTGFIAKQAEVEAAIKAAKAAKDALGKDKSVANLEAFVTATSAIDALVKDVKSAKLEGDTATKEEVSVEAGDVTAIKSAAAKLAESADAYKKTFKSEAEVKAEQKADEKEEVAMDAEVKKGDETPATEDDAKEPGKSGVMGRMKAWWGFKRASSKASTAVESAMYNTMVARYTAVAKYVSVLK